MLWMQVRNENEDCVCNAGKFATSSGESHCCQCCNGISITGYKYYKPPPEVKYRYPAPGSQPLDNIDHRHMYKLDWKTPFRVSEYNVRSIELRYDDDDPRSATNYVGSIPEFDGSHKRFGPYDQEVLNTAAPVLKSELVHPELRAGTSELRDELWADFEKYPEVQFDVQENHAPGQGDLDDAYNQANE